MKDKVIMIVSAILNVDKSTLSEDSSPDNIPNWDSLNHMNIIMAIEEEFDITFSEMDIIEMLSIESIVEKLNENI